MYSLENYTMNQQSGDDDIELARRIHGALSNRPLPVFEGIEYAATTVLGQILSADILEISHPSSDIVALLICDVAAHGVSSVLIANYVRMVFERHIAANVSPAVVMERINREMVATFRKPVHLTAFLAYLNLNDNQLTYCNAGHVYPFVYKKEKSTLVPCTTAGQVVGIFNKGHLEENSIALEPGDWIVLYTDGVFRIFDPAANTADVPVEKQLHDTILRTAQNSTPRALVADIKSRADALAATAQNQDDIVFCAIEILSQSKKNQLKETLGFKVNDPVYISFLRYYEEIDRTVSPVLQSMDSFGYSDEAIRKMKIALTELLANGIGHGNEEDYSKKVTMGYHIDRLFARIGILDEGKGFDHTVVRDPTAPENIIRDSGRGIFIVRKYVDTVEFNATGNRVLICKWHHTVKASTETRK